MVDFASKAKILEKMAIDNSPVILTAVGVVGTVTTAVLTGKATIKAVKIIESERFQRKIHGDTEQRTNKEKVRLVWKCYIPAVGTGALTIGSIVFANRIGTRRAAAMAAAYTISEKAFSEYREKVVEQIGDNKEQRVRDGLAQDYVERNPPSEGNLIVLGDQDVLCCDLFSGRYLRSSVEALKKAMNDTNYQIMHQQSATLSDFYDRIGLPHTDVSDEIGWNFDKLLELEFSTVLADDGRTPCVAYRFQVHPVRGFHKLY